MVMKKSESIKRIYFALAAEDFSSVIVVLVVINR